MNRLMPPPQRDLPEAVRRELRTGLVRTSRSTTRPRPTRRVVLPALALTGVGTAAAAVALNLFGAGLPATGVPVPAGPPTATPAQTAGSKIPAAEPIDRGPLSSSVTDQIVTSCLVGSPGGGTVRRVHLARQTSIAGPVVVLTDTVGILHLCRDGSDITGPPLDAGGPLGDLDRPTPSRELPVVQLTGPSGSGSGPATGDTGTIESASLAYYRVVPDVASLQLRLTVDGHTGPWFEASIADGYAFAAASENHFSRSGDDPHDFHVEDRAFDTAGHELDIDHPRR